MGEFTPLLGTRAQYPPQAGSINLSLDYNAAPSGNARGTEVVIPDNASPAVRAAAERYNQLVAEFALQQGIKDYPIRGVRTRAENQRGVPHTIHAEPFFNTDLEMQRAIQANPAAFAALYPQAFGDIPNVRMIAPHGVGRDRGAASEIFGDETTFGETLIQAALGQSGAPTTPQGGTPVGLRLTPAPQGGAGATPQPGAATPQPGAATPQPGAATPQPAPQRGGLFGLFGPQEGDYRTADERRRDLFANLGIGLAGMTLNPNQGLIQAAQSGIASRREAAKGRRDLELTKQQRNRTAEWLRSQGRADLANAVLSGSIGASDAVKLAYTPPKDSRTALIQNYEYAKKSGYKGTFDEFLRAGGGGGSVVNVGGGADESALQKELGKTLGEDVATSIRAGQQASRNLVRYDVLEQLLQSAPQGGVGAFVQMATNFGLKLEGSSDIEAAQALISQLVPEQRQPGSGPMSDADLALFKQSLPRVINTPGGNELILQTLRGIAEYDMQAGQIAQRLASGEIDVPTYLRDMASLKNPIPPVMRQQAPSPSMSADDAANTLLGK